MCSPHIHTATNIPHFLHCEYLMPWKSIEITVICLQSQYFNVVLGYVVSTVHGGQSVVVSGCIGWCKEVFIQRLYLRVYCSCYDMRWGERDPTGLLFLDTSWINAVSYWISTIFQHVWKFLFQTLCISIWWETEIVCPIWCHLLSFREFTWTSTCKGFALTKVNWLEVWRRE